MAEMIKSLKSELNSVKVMWFKGKRDNAALKAENERLRKDAERYKWLRDPKTDMALVIDKVTGEIPSIYPEEEGIKTYEYRAGEELDEAIDAAMKDFSTTQKEEKMLNDTWED